MSDKEEILKVIQTFFEVGKTKNFSALRDIQINSEEFSSLSDVPPYSLKNYSESIALEELRFSSISDYDYEIKNEKTSVFGTTGIATFELNQKGYGCVLKHATRQLLHIFCFSSLPDWLRNHARKNYS